MDFKSLLMKQGVSKALIVDDGVDPSPFVSDLTDSEEDWAVFWADLSVKDRKLLDQVFPEYAKTDAEMLMQNQAFISLVFEHRNEFEGAALKKVFETFLSNQSQVRKFIDTVSEKLSGFEVQVTEVGRDFIAAANEADLIVIDLFLGSEQADADKKRSIAGLKEVLRQRPENPPLVLLTSAHHNLLELRHEFRDDTGLLASGFRTISKSDIVQDGRFEQLLFELVEHRGDALKLWTFLKSWENGIGQAMERAQREVRKLDLEDLSHVKQMLSSEGVPLGGYMVDVMDGVLAHELEAEQGVIDAAIALNSLEATSFPPNSISGNKNTLEVVRRTLFVHDNRRQLDPTDGFPVSLGDILAVRPDLENLDSKKGTIFEEDANRVFLVLTPLCDLVREPPKAKRVFLLAGTFYDLGALNFRQIATGEHTPVLDISTARRGIVQWEFKHVETLDKNTLTHLLSADGPCFVSARMKEHPAIALQQKLLGDLGRVGELKTMPSMFPVKCTAYYTNTERELVQLKTSLDGVLVGHKTGRLAFDAAHRFDLLKEISEAEANAYDTSKGKLSAAIEPRSLDALFTRGIDYKIDAKPKPCMVPGENEDVEIGKILFNVSAEAAFSDVSQHQGAGLIFEINEVTD